jgi:hypothetical protein
MIFVKQKCQKTVVKIYKRQKIKDQRQKTQENPLLLCSPKHLCEGEGESLPFDSGGQGVGK